LGIADPLREGVASAVAEAKKAGIFVRMVTGDNLVTATAVAKSCGIFSDERGDLAIQGSELRSLTPKQLDEILPRLRVVARASPTDKFLLVTRLNGFSLPDGRYTHHAARCMIQKLSDATHLVAHSVQHIYVYI
jgi:magnesium-transporting ATPase (P-type)